MIRKQPRAKVGVIGLGIIGSRAAACLRGAGHQVYVWNRSPRAEPHFLGSAVEVAELSDLLQLFVSDDAALLEVIRTIAPVLGSRHLVAGHATVAPATAREAAAIVQERGARYLDAPFTGSKAAAQSGQLVYYVAAPEAALREARPLLEVTAKTIVPIGGAPGQASAVKLATNSLIANTVQGLAEALALARAAGVDPAQFAEALENSPARSGISDGKLPGMIKGHYEPHFSLKHLFKDLDLALRLAAEHGVTLPTTATVAATVYGGVQRGWGEQDCSVLARNYDPAAPASLVPARRVLPPAPALPGGEAPRLPEKTVGTPPGGTELPAAPPRQLPPPTAETLPSVEVQPITEETFAPMDQTSVPAADKEVATSAAGRRTVFPDVPEKPNASGAAAAEKLPAPSDQPRGANSSKLPVLPVLPTVTRRSLANQAPPARSPAPPAFPFAPPAPRAPADPAPPPPGVETKPVDSPASSSSPPSAPRRSLFSSLFGRDK